MSALSTTGGGELNAAYNGSLTAYPEVDGSFVQRDLANHTLQPFVRFTGPLLPCAYVHGNVYSRVQASICLCIHCPGCNL